MARGGKRVGAGRPAGSATRRTREIADAAAKDGLSPLEVMLRAMREHALADRWDQAAAVAKDAAPIAIRVWPLSRLAAKTAARFNQYQ